MKNKRKTSCYLQVNPRKYHIIIPENACKRNVISRVKVRKLHVIPDSLRVIHMLNRT